ncbi:hypothetical protein LCGC14_0209830 [marine sediment metagenome]|uniref:DUF4145 domain-containing protein n=1 Tax=marine sediment metagenome TaxID=412755 RepID=A0A0F9UG21_9ZZZZ|nr:hypothetical protein [Halomonas sp.]HDZ48226.1 hypothetical protein [Halomonas sp.]HEB03492.1 hypothetical protein [Halomonas sp.]
MNIQRFLSDHGALLTEYERCAFRDFGFPYQVTPHNYINEAEECLARESTGGDRDAVANAKRSIDCQIEAVLETLGLQVKGGFPVRIKAIRKLGLIAPRILEKTNRIRNAVEHDFTNPTREQAETAVDTALLFVEITQRVFRQMVMQCAIYDPTPKITPWVNWGPNYVVFEMVGDADAIEIKGEVKGKVSFKQVVGRNDKEYVPLLKFLLSGDFAYSDLPDEDLIRQLTGDLGEI